MLTGTSIRALIDSVFVRPLGQSDALTILPLMSGEMLGLLIATPALIVAGWAVSRATPDRAWLIASGTLRVVGAVVLLTAVVPALQSALHITVFAGEFAYVPLAALIVLPRLDYVGPGLTTTRAFVAVLAVAETLHAFPVAGIQVVLGMLFPVFCAVVILDDGVREYGAALAGVSHEDRWRVATRGLTVAVLLWAGWQYQSAMRLWVDGYRSAVPLGVSHSSWMRADPTTTASVQTLVAGVEDCRQLVTYPGSYSLNLWADIPPANGYNATYWPRLLTDREERAIVEQLESSDDPVCFVVRPGGSSGLDPQGGPLERYLAGFVPARRQAATRSS